MVTPAPKCRGSTTLALWTDPVDRGLHGCVRLAHDVRVTSSLGNLDPAPAVRSRAPGWRDPRLWIGIAIVAASVVAGARLLARADDLVSVWAVAEQHAAGDVLTADDLVARRVRFADDADRDRYLLVDRQLPAGLRLARDVGAGELLPAGSLGAADADTALDGLAITADARAALRSLSHLAVNRDR